MNYVICLKNLFESIPEYRKIVVLIFSVDNGNSLLHDCGFLKDDNNHLSSEFKKILEQNENLFNYIENEEESIRKKTLKS